MEVQETPYMGTCCFVGGSPLQCLPKQEKCQLLLDRSSSPLHASKVQESAGYSLHDIHPDVPVTIRKGFKGFPN